MNKKYIGIFALEGIMFGALFYIVIRQSLRKLINMSELLPQFPFVGIVANIIGFGLVLLLVIGGTISGMRLLGLEKM